MEIPVTEKGAGGAGGAGGVGGAGGAGGVGGAGGAGGVGGTGGAGGAGGAGSADAAGGASRLASASGATEYKRGVQLPTELVEAARDAAANMERKIDSGGAATESNVTTGSAPEMNGMRLDPYKMSKNLMSSIADDADATAVPLRPIASSRGVEFADFLGGEPVGLARFPLAVVNIANREQPPRCGVPMARILFMATDEEMAARAEAMIAAWPDTRDPRTGKAVPKSLLDEADRQPMANAHIVRTVKLFACMKDLAEQGEAAVVGPHATHLFDAWDGYQRARVECIQLAKEGKLHPKDTRALFANFELTDAVADEEDRKREQRSALKAAGTAPEWTDRSQAEDDLKTAERLRARGVAPEVSETPRPPIDEATVRRAQRSVARSRARLQLPEFDPLPELEARSAEAKRASAAARSFPAPLRRMLNDLYDEGSPMRGIVDPHVFLSILPDSSVNPCFESPEWQRQARLFGEARGSPWTAPSRLFEDSVPRPFVRVYPFLVPGVDIDTVRGLLTSKVEDMDILPRPLAAWTDLSRLRLDGATEVWRDKRQAQRMRVAKQSGAAAEDYVRQAHELGLDARGEVIGRERASRFKAMASGWVGPTAGMENPVLEHRLASRVKDGTPDLPPMPRDMAPKHIDRVTGKTHYWGLTPKKTAAIHRALAQKAKRERRREKRLRDRAARAQKRSDGRGDTGASVSVRSPVDATDVPVVADA